jgi:hypothetical protein
LIRAGAKVSINDYSLYCNDFRNVLYSPPVTYENPKAELLRKVLLPDVHVEMKCRGPRSFLNESGYVGEVFDDAFEFKRVTNANEYYRNENVGPPETERHRVRFEDIIWIDVFDTMKRDP